MNEHPEPLTTREALLRLDARMCEFIAAISKSLASLPFLRGPFTVAAKGWTSHAQRYERRAALHRETWVGRENNFTER